MAKVNDIRSALIQNDPFLRNSNWKLVDQGDVKNAEIARKYLVNPKRREDEEWGEIWVGDALQR
ncbi:MAG: hypothetical protein EOO62_23415 [Hymenobacter sp.]|nr:MAG: hypothetical protein EOO62_23415 [Hymenobacter sp.]